MNNPMNSNVLSPCAGVIVFKLSPGNDKCVIVKAKSKGEFSQPNFGFPKGKRHKNETIEQCAFRELYEETGISLAQITLVDNVHLIELSDRGNIATTYLIGKFIDIEHEHVFTFDHDELESSELISVDRAYELVKRSRSDILHEAYNIIMTQN